jgi:hypothetical protein
MRSPITHAALTVQHGTLAKNGNGIQRPTTNAGREVDQLYLHMARQLRARYKVSLRCITSRGIAVALMNLVDQGRLDFEALRADLDGRDMREITRLLSADSRLGLSLRGH